MPQELSSSLGKKIYLRSQKICFDTKRIYNYKSFKIKTVLEIVNQGNEFSTSVWMDIQENVFIL